MSTPQVTILVPNHKTPELTKLCLRLLRKHTDPNLARVIVIDNQSEDESVEYLRGLNWITLIERDISADPTPSLSHAAALDEALAQVDTPYVLSIHTDTLVKRPDWLPYLLSQFKNDNIAAVGSWKLESKPFIRRMAKKFEYMWQSRYYQMINKQDHALEGRGNNFYYLRSHCALYRMDLIRKLNLSFGDEGDTAGRAMHRKLQEAGFALPILRSEDLSVYVDHLNHATMVFNPHLYKDGKPSKKGLKRVKTGLKQIQAERIFADDTLDG